uniref:Death domain-containing protein n=1 Tax=Strigamia maritima TaxID=126957 RepID=T1IHK4_STRMM
MRAHRSAHVIEMASGNDANNVIDSDKDESLVPDAVPTAPAEEIVPSNNDSSGLIQSSHSRKIPELPSEGIIRSDPIPKSHTQDLPGDEFNKGFQQFGGFPPGLFSSKFKNFNPGSKEPSLSSANFMNQTAVGGANVTAIQIGHANNLHFGNNITINHGLTKTSGYKRTKNEKPKKSTVPIDILTSKVIVSEDVMLIVKHGDLGYKWKDFGMHLSLTNGALETVEYEHRQYGLNELVFQTLIKWKEKVGDSATVGKLANALDVIGREDLALSLLNSE